MALRPGQIRLLAGAGMAMFLGAIFVAKPRTLLPTYTLTATADGPDTVALLARPDEPIDVPLQAHAFFLAEDRVVSFEATVQVEAGGVIRAVGPRPPGPGSVGLLVGHADSTPSPEEAWEERASEGAQRPTFRLLLAPMPP